MASRTTVQDWHHAIDELKTSAIKFSGVVDEILTILKYSYDNIKEEQVRSCFLYCSLFPEDDYIDKKSLIEIWMAEGLIDEKKGREWRLNRGYEILAILVRACILMDGASYVRMHDVVREMAIWVASDQDRHIVQAGFGLTKIPKFEDLKNVRRMSLMENEIENISESLNCPELTTLLLGNNKKLVTISGEFFLSMPKLLVLDLSYNERLIGLPEQISNLVSLRYLNLSCTKIERLPVGLWELKMLIHLNLQMTDKLECLQGISKLSSLRSLRLQYSNVLLDIGLINELQVLEHLEFITVSMLGSFVRELLNYPKVERCIQQVVITERSEESVQVLGLPATDNLHHVTLVKCGMLEIKIEKTPWNKTPSDLCFSNLSDVSLGMCNGLKELTWLLFAPNLIKLTVCKLDKLEEIISKEKAASFLEEETCNIIPFQKLQFLYLDGLPELKSIYWKALPFQHLRFLINNECKKLRKLPLDSKSVNNVEEFVLGYNDEEYIKGIEWEDEATQQRFLPSCKLRG